MSDKMVVLPGERCRKAREAMGWTTAEAAKRMHLSHTYLLALEADDYERLPEATFVKGYLKNYARLLGLPADEVANTFQQMVNEDAFDKPLELPALPRKPGLMKRPLVWGGLVILLVVAVLALWPDKASEPETAGFAPVEDNMSEDAGEQDAMDAPVESGDDEAGVVDSDMADSSDAVTGEQTTDEMQEAIDEELVEQEPAIDPALLAPNGLDRLVFDFSANCWLEVKDANGRVLRQGEQPASTTMQVDGKGPFSLKIGNAAAISELLLNGEAVTLPTDSPGRVVKLTLP